MAAVQAVGIERVCEMFELKKIPYFAITSGSNIIHSCKDSDNIDEASNELRNFLELMHQSSNAIYTLVLFEEKPSAINKKTLSESNFAINFRLNLEGEIGRAHV